MGRHVHGEGKAAAFESNLYKQLELGKDGGDIVVRSIITCKSGELVKMPPPPPTPAKNFAAPRVAAEPVKEEDPWKDAITLAVELEDARAMLEAEDRKGAARK